MALGADTFSDIIRNFDFRMEVRVRTTATLDLTSWSKSTHTIWRICSDSCPDFKFDNPNTPPHHLAHTQRRLYDIFRIFHHVMAGKQCPSEFASVVGTEHTDGGWTVHFWDGTILEGKTRTEEEDPGDEIIIIHTYALDGKQRSGDPVPPFQPAPLPENMLTRACRWAKDIFG